MNETVSKSLLAGDTFMPEMHLCRIAKFMQTGDTNYIYKN